MFGDFAAGLWTFSARGLVHRSLVCDFGGLGGRGAASGEDLALCAFGRASVERVEGIEGWGQGGQGAGLRVPRRFGLG